VPIVLKSGSLNLLEPSGPVKACIGIALLYVRMLYALGTYTDSPFIILDLFEGRMSYIYKTTQ
jgi:hypothetical protein